MAPSYPNGNFILLTSIGRIRIGDAIVADIEEIGLVLKRIKFIDSSKMILTGDNPKFDSSVCNIPLDRKLIIGKVLLNLSLLNFFSNFSGIYKRFNI